MTTRPRCACGAYVLSGCRKCGTPANRARTEVITAIKAWAERRRTIGHLNHVESIVIDDLLIEVFGAQ